MSRKWFNYRLLAKDIDEDLVDVWAYEHLGWCWIGGDPNSVDHLVCKHRHLKSAADQAAWAKGFTCMFSRDNPNLTNRYYYFNTSEDMVAFKLVWGGY